MHVSRLKEHGIPDVYVDLLIERGIESLNPVQVEAVKKGLLSGVNLVVSAPTASGKTLIGELALVKNCWSGNGLSIYLVPLKALANEKSVEFNYLKKIGLSIGVSTGDYDRRDEELGLNDVVIATYERFDSLLRLKPSWINRVKCIVIDEMHLISDPERGPTIEMIIARLLDRGVQIIGLSATIGKPEVLSTWIKGELVVSDWRPVKLIEGYYDRGSGRIVFPNHKVEKVSFQTGDSLLNMVLHNISRDIQTLVFIHNRRKVEEYANKTAEYLDRFVNVDQVKLRGLTNDLSESPSKTEKEVLSKLLQRGVAYHHAGLSIVARRVVENAFLDRLVKVVYATPTLAAGVNLPARRVLVSIKRYDPTLGLYRRIPVYEYKQMAGRAGRPRFDKIGESIVYDAEESVALEYINSEPEPVVSHLGSERSLRIHTLSLVASYGPITRGEIADLLGKTLFFSNKRMDFQLHFSLNIVLKNLVKWGMVRIGGDELRATDLGLTTAFTYLDPLSVVRFLKYIKTGASTFMLLHIIAYTPDYIRSKPYIPLKLVKRFDEDAESDAESGVTFSVDEDEKLAWLISYVHAKMLYDWINEVDEDKLYETYGVGPGDVHSARETSSWIAYALSRVAKIDGSKVNPIDLERLSLRLKYGVKDDALELVSLEGIGRVRARILINAGIRNVNDLAKTPESKLMSLPFFGPAVAKKIKEQVKNAKSS